MGINNLQSCLRACVGLPKSTKRTLSHIENGVLEIIVLIDENYNTTYENKDIKTEEGRKKHFGAVGHWRIFGGDFKDMLE